MAYIAGESTSGERVISTWLCLQKAEHGALYMDVVAMALLTVPPSSATDPAMDLSADNVNQFLALIEERCCAQHPSLRADAAVNEASDGKYLALTKAKLALELSPCRGPVSYLIGNPFSAGQALTPESRDLLGARLERIEGNKQAASAADSAPSTLAPADSNQPPPAAAATSEQAPSSAGETTSTSSEKKAKKKKGGSKQRTRVRTDQLD